MPVREIALPVGAKNVKPALPTVTRSSKDGDIPVVRIFDGDNFVGETLEGHWTKRCLPASLEATALLVSGQLELSGYATGSPNIMITSNAAIPVVQDGYVDVHMELNPSGTPDEICYFDFYLQGAPPVAMPDVEDWGLKCQLKRVPSTGNTYIRVYKIVDGSLTTIYSETLVTNYEGTFRVKFRPNDDEIDVYFHDGSGDVIESDKLTLIDDSDDMFPHAAQYPSLWFTHLSSNSHYAYSNGIWCTYPDTIISYDLDEDDIAKGDVKCYDAMGSVTESDWRRVYSEDHDFVGDCVIENGVIRLVVDEASAKGLELYYWTGSAWSELANSLWTMTRPSSYNIIYPFLKEITTLNRAESIRIKVRLCTSSTESDTVYNEMYFTLERGKRHIMITGITQVPREETVIGLQDDSPCRRFAYLGDSKLSDEDKSTATIDNTVMTDNYMVLFDNTGDGIFPFIATNQKPDGETKAFRAHISTGHHLQLWSITPDDYPNTNVYVGFHPYSDNDHLFQEAESGTTNASPASTADGTASGGFKVVLDALNEYVYTTLTAITDLPLGRYLLLVRAKDSAQVGNDLQIKVYNSTDASYCNEEQDDVHVTVAATWGYYPVFFDIRARDSGDTIQFHALKDTGTANNLDIDYFLIVPIGCGNAYVQDIAHSEMRTLEQGFRITDTTTFELYSGLGLGWGSGLGSAYTDAMAVAAVEAELTLDLAGVLTAKRIKNQLDNEGFFTGAGDDLRLYHDGTDSYIVNSQGNLILQNVGGDIQLETQEFFLDVTGKVQIRDKDDSDAVLFELDSTARTLKIGTVTDPLPVTIAGDLTVDATAIGNVTAILDAKAGDDSRLQMSEDGTPMALFVYHAGNNRIEIYNYTSGEHFYLKDVGGAEVTGDLMVSGDLQVIGNDIKDSAGNVMLSFDGAGEIDVMGKLDLTYSITDANFEHEIEVDSLATQDGSFYIKGLELNLDPVVNTGFRDQGYKVALHCSTQATSAQTGILDDLWGIWIQVGGHTGNAMTLKDVIGLKITPLHTAGIIENYYGIYHDIPVQTATVTDSYGMYIKMPAVYAAAGIEMCAYFTGDGRVVRICDTTYALDVVGSTRFTGLLDVHGTTYIDTDSGIDTFYITRIGGTSQALAVYVDDGNLWFNYSQDEVDASAHCVHWDILTGATGAHYYRWRIKSVELMTLTELSLTLANDLTVSGTGTSTFAGKVAINETGAGPLLRLGSSADTTDPIELLRFYTERAWSFRKRSTGASTRLCLEADNDGKLFQIGYDDGVVYAAKFSIHDAQADCSVTLAHNVTVEGVLSVLGDDIKDSGGNVIISSDGSGFIDYLGQQGTPSDNDVLAWDTVTSKWVVQAQIGAGGGPGTGTQWKLPVWNTTTTLGDSMVSQNSAGTALTIGAGTVAMSGGLSGVTALAMGGALTGVTTISASGLVTVDGLNPEADLADTLGTSSKTWLGLYARNWYNALGELCMHLTDSAAVAHFDGYIGSDFDPVLSKLQDMGATTTYIWDECYADNWNNISSWKTFDNPFEILRGFGPQALDEYELEHSLIDDWIRPRRKMYQYPDDWPDEEKRADFTLDKRETLRTPRLDDKGKHATGEDGTKLYNLHKVKQWDDSGGHYKLKGTKKDKEGKDKEMGNYSDGFKDEDFEHEPAWSINKGLLVAIQAINMLKADNDDLRSRVIALEEIQ